MTWCHMLGACTIRRSMAPRESAAQAGHQDPCSLAACGGRIHEPGVGCRVGLSLPPGRVAAPSGISSLERAESGFLLRCRPSSLDCAAIDSGADVFAVVPPSAREKGLPASEVSLAADLRAAEERGGEGKWITANRYDLARIPCVGRRRRS